MKLINNIALATSLVSVVSAKVIGVAPNQQDLYKPDADGKWRCLGHPEIVLDFNQVNDDYCDCPDGSDEPGTSACPNGKFYCENKGHVPSYIKASQVNDGRCDYSQCCDGSDEWDTPVDCPSKCDEINKEYQKQLNLQEQTYKIGVEKLRKTINAANRIKDKLEKDIVSRGAIFDFLSRELNKKRQDLEILQAGELDPAVVKAKQDIKTSFENIKTELDQKFNSFTSSTYNLNNLSKILDALVQTFNENLKDAAVKDTVDNYLAHLEKYKEQYESEKSSTYQTFDTIKQSITDKLNSIDLDHGDTSAIKSKFDEISTTLSENLIKHDFINERAIDLENLLSHLINNYNPNFNDPNVKEAVNSFQDFSVNKESFKVPTEETISWFKEQTSKINELAKNVVSSNSGSVKPKLISSTNGPFWEKLKYRYRLLVNEFLGIESKEQYRIQPYQPKESKSDLEVQVEELNKDFNEQNNAIKSINEELSKNYGPHDILRPLKDIAIKGHIGEYDYDLFFTGNVHQKGHNNNIKIGSFESIEVKDISPKEHQLVLKYTNGARCWNGPLRQAVVNIDCGAENELIAVTEPEKCEYHFRVKSPIGCKLPESEEKSEQEIKNEVVHDEL
ncbi:Glucosidase 2 subunit beta [Wickerhamomyces ciferrii]|uniref:Glucosidase 2 subunit beta n=1 Tax=Wickerhamomyces ciferrii (strain ATCC 14091 / BCRC 22168 / CBS 111 / JCM 3599 / NBRC 0793 / NRRL Y-1031 F-60-10) TaxID=1206466 RepID=K0KIF4_WICCF|nr:Glucosidase 2 subunit beta [Wickerhamomyces ciferrii]CCH45000.1 Glucosidase 2 subunit beta [Wickerhamomyces ciferrii]